MRVSRPEASCRCCPLVVTVVVAMLACATCGATEIAEDVPCSEKRQCSPTRGSVFLQSFVGTQNEAFDDEEEDASEVRMDNELADGGEHQSLLADKAALDLKQPAMVPSAEQILSGRKNLLLQANEAAKEKPKARDYPEEKEARHYYDSDKGAEPLPETMEGPDSTERWVFEPAEDRYLAEPKEEDEYGCIGIACPQPVQPLPEAGSHKSLAAFHGHLGLVGLVCLLAALR